jgi:hypothetical protein
LKSWTKVLRETEWERKAARTRRVVDAAAAKLQRAKAKPQSLDGAERPKPRPGLRIVATLELRYMHRAADDQRIAFLYGTKALKGVCFFTHRSQLPSGSTRVPPSAKGIICSSPSL